VSGPAHLAGVLLRHAENDLAWPSVTAHPGPGAPTARGRTMHKRDPGTGSTSVLCVPRRARA